MEKGRLEAFTDGVIAVIITIMVLELKAPHEASWQALLENWPIMLSYVLSFIYVGIYWNNHHHMMHVVEHVNGKVMWANLHLSVLAVAVSVRHELAERGAAGAVARADGAVWFRAADGGAVVDSALAHR